MDASVAGIQVNNNYADNAVVFEDVSTASSTYMVCLPHVINLHFIAAKKLRTFEIDIPVSRNKSRE